MWPSEIHYLVHRERYAQLRQEAEAERLFKRLPPSPRRFKTPRRYGRYLHALLTAVGAGVAIK